ncbi:type II secretion system protein G [Anaerohalosphaera lusitana]|uniref:Type II secretion system protein G n=1 Tax=Anaerohalosphaera lusitana TaxID=1936003 RepID=A0A1U9NMP3_9BACT|nr:type II secretion system protein [Anaerohalosphaera lusitana]AQT69183.1 type II secretion system protein G [Anaerohalosphaera lusitana]
MKKAFTLIELLVVISIIALLLAVMMPALGKVKANAKKVICATNIRQNGQAFALYAADNDGKLYVGPGGPMSSFYSWGGVTMDWDYGYLPGSWNKDTNPYERALNKYLPEDNPVYICPSDPKGDSKLFAPFGTDREPRHNGQAYYTTTGTSYQYNAFLTSVSKYTKMSQVRRASNTPLVFEWPVYDVVRDALRPANWTDKPRWSFHDNSGRGTEPRDVDENGNNTCFVDGHTEYITYVKGKEATAEYDLYDGIR